jgi:nitroreductase
MMSNTAKASRREFRWEECIDGEKVSMTSSEELGKENERRGMLDLLTSRVSHPRLTAPAPSPDQLEIVYQAALRTPDHKCLKPWRFLVIEGESLNKLGDLFCQAAKIEEGDLSEAKEAKYLSMPLRAPMIIVGISENVEHPKVPVEEQVISCGVAMGYMLLALQAQGYGGMWRTGAMAVNEYVRKGLGLSEQETLVGFLYIGTPQADAKKISAVSSCEYFKAW